MALRVDVAPGAPGIAPRWTSSAKSGVGTALATRSPLWFTLSHGVVNEVYFPRTDSACLRDMELIVTGEGLFAEEKRDCDSTTLWASPGVPAFEVTTTHRGGRFRIEKRVVSDPRRPVLLQHIRFEAAEDLRLFTLLAPHLVNAGAENSAWIARHGKTEVLFASGRQHYLALVASTPWTSASAGYVGTSDGWQQLKARGRLDPAYARADDGNVALAAELALEGGGEVTLALGFGQTAAEAANRARASLKAGFAAAWEAYVARWKGWQAGLEDLGGAAYRASTAVLAAHKAADQPGAIVASLSIPWGFSKGDDDLGGYHLIWPRDLVQTAGGFLAAGDRASAQAVLDYLAEVQEPSGRWPQNMWLDGKPYWHGQQMDEVAFPILLAEMLRRHGLGRAGLRRYLPMIRAAAGYLVGNGPVTAQDRWEEDAGYSPFTLAVEIAALLAAADLLAEAGEAEAARHLRDTADCWNAQIEDWCYAGDPARCQALGIDGHYVRIARPGPTDRARTDGETPIRNQVEGASALPTASVIATDALALVRFGLRAPDDPRILATVKAIDHALKVDLPQGPLWRRYTGDGYGEHDDGRPFDGTGRGRAWPLLAGERAHYELAAGRPDAARALLATLEASAAGGLIPEQSWDAADIPQAELFLGRPAGSAMPLVWAHAEHIKLLRGLRDGAVFDCPPQAAARYANPPPDRIRIWRFDNRIETLPAGRNLRLDIGAPARVVFSRDGWVTVEEAEATPNGLGLWSVELTPGAALDFTFFWTGPGTWEGKDFRVAVG